ncbi:B-cell receptor CD22-like [Engraulis encrasicolus]|uniref:B-cell receptor CD22-like n=1 Tax=Engraulis encrasicolus TaxID=184585 RepID=UPI002FD2CD48
MLSKTLPLGLGNGTGCRTEHAGDYWDVQETRKPCWKVKPSSSHSYSSRPYSPRTPLTSFTIGSPISPKSVTATVVNHTKPLIEGQQYHLGCSVESVAPVQDLTIIWYRGDQAVGQSDYTRFSFIDIDHANVFDNLTITASRLDRGAIYSCAARLDLNTSKPIPVTRSNSIQLEVLYGPIGLNHSGNVNVGVGNALELFCYAEANPIPTYNWTRNSITLEKENSGKLCIESVSVDHSGEYSCSVGNGIGSNQTAKMMVDVYYKPRMLNITGNVTTKAGNTLTLACHANANPTPFYQWRHNGTVLSNQKSDTLEIYSMNVTNGGVYECMATNTQGQDSARMTVIVTVENYGDAVVIGTWTVVCVLALVIAAVCLWRRRRQQPQ